MSFRSNFTFRIAQLIIWIDAQGWLPILDYAKRSEHEQVWLFSQNNPKRWVTNCDGVKKISPHQYESSPACLACDIYIDDGKRNINNENVYLKAHEYWEKLGGAVQKGALKKDQGHFQMTKITSSGTI